MTKIAFAEVNGMGSICYKKLWKILIDRDMIRRDLREACGLSTLSMAKLSKGQNISTEILVRICDVLNCDISDICEIVREGKSDAFVAEGSK